MRTKSKGCSGIAEIGSDLHRWLTSVKVGHAKSHSFVGVLRVLSMRRHRHARTTGAIDSCLRCRLIVPRWPHCS